MGDLGSPRSTAMGSSTASSGGSVAGDASDRWADICDSDDDVPSQPTASFSSTGPPLRPEGIWFSSPPGNFLQAKANKLEAQARTTLTVKNLPEGCTHDELRRILDEV